MIKNKETTESIKDLARVLSDKRTHPDTSGIALASGFSRILSRIQKQNDDGTMSFTPFCILTAFRGNLSRNENLTRNLSLEQDLQLIDNKMGFYKLLGRFAEKDEDAQDMSFDEAHRLGKTKEVTEESLLVLKPESMEYNDFETRMSQLGSKYNQDSILICDGKLVFLLESNGQRSEIGTKMNIGKFEQIYSVMRKGTRAVPFTFAAVQQPATIYGRVIAEKRGRLCFNFRDITKHEMLTSKYYEEEINS